MYYSFTMVEFFEKSIQIKEKILPVNHLSWAISYSNMSHVYDHMGDYSKALSFLEKTLVVRQKSLPATHPDIKTTIGSISYMKSKV